MKDLTWAEWLSSLGARLSPKVVLPVAYLGLAMLLAHFNVVNLPPGVDTLIVAGLGVAAPPAPGIDQREVEAEARGKRRRRR